MINFYHDDYINITSQKEDDYYDWAICDIPYGIGVGKMAYLSEVNTTVKQKNGTRLNGNKNKKPYSKKDWDSSPPPQEYFNEVSRVSKNQIIFGIEYVEWGGVGEGRIKWNKGVADGMSFKKYEMAYCSLFEHEVDIDLLWAGMCQAKSLSEPMTQQGNKKRNEKRVHPCHKPIMLYERLLLDFVKDGQSVLDTHGGGMSIAIACDKLNVDLDVCEIDKEYYDIGTKRYREYKRQLKLF